MCQSAWLTCRLTVIFHFACRSLPFMSLTSHNCYPNCASSAIKLVFKSFSLTSSLSDCPLPFTMQGFTFWLIQIFWKTNLSFLFQQLMLPQHHFKHARLSLWLLGVCVFGLFLCSHHSTHPLICLCLKPVHRYINITLYCYWLVCLQSASLIKEIASAMLVWWTALGSLLSVVISIKGKFSLFLCAFSQLFEVPFANAEICSCYYKHASNSHCLFTWHAQILYCGICSI